MTRENMINALMKAGSVEILSGKLVEADETLGSEICGFLFGSENAFCTDVFYSSKGAPIAMDFKPDGILITVPGLDASFYEPSLLAYSDISESSMAALCKMVRP